MKLQIAVLFLIYIPIMSQHATAQDDFQSFFTPVWQRATSYLIEVAELMPEDLYDYKPQSEIMSFKEQLLHIAGNIHSLHGRFIVPPLSPWEPPNPQQTRKEEVIRELKHACSLVEKSLQNLTQEELNKVSENFWGPDPMTPKGIFLLIRDHMTHHRGQLVIYLRMNEIVPPRYRGW